MDAGSGRGVCYTGGVRRAGAKTLEQMKQEKILDPWSKWSGDFVKTDVFIETLYNSLTGMKGEFVKHN